MVKVKMVKKSKSGYSHRMFFEIISFIIFVSFVVLIFFFDLSTLQFIAVILSAGLYTSFYVYRSFMGHLLARIDFVKYHVTYAYDDTLNRSFLNPKNKIKKRSQEKMKEKYDSIETFIKEADFFLTKTDANVLFSDNGFQQFKNSINKYICELLTESIKTSNRYGEITIYPTHVQQASQKLYFLFQSNFRNILKTFGGIVFGISVSNFYLMTTSNLFSSSSITFSAILLFLGTFLIAYPFK